MSLVPVRIASAVTLDAKNLSAACVDELVSAHTHPNPRYARARKLKTPGWWDEPANFISARWSEGGKVLTLPRASLEWTLSTLVKHGYPPRLDDFRVEGERIVLPPNRPERQQRDYQLRLIRSGVEQPVCLWRAPPGSGKTTAAIGLIQVVCRRALVLVHMTELVTQWVRRLKEDLAGPVDFGIFQGAKRWLGRDVTIATTQSAVRHLDELVGKFGLVVCDEVQGFAASSFQDVVAYMDAKRVVGISADERRADGREFLIYEQFGQVACEVKREELVARDLVHQVELRVVPTTFRADWWKRLSYSGRIKERDRMLEQMFSSSSRNDVVVQCAAECVREAGQAIVLTMRREHCHAVDRMLVSAGLRSGLLIGGDDYRQQFCETRDGFVRGDVKVGVGTLQAVGVGFDLPAASRGIIAAPAANSRDADKQLRQFVGRFSRTSSGKKDAAVYYLWDKELSGPGPLQNLRRWFPGSVVVRHAGKWLPAGEYMRELRRSK